ncbi:Cutinase-like protein [Paramyrothecium foliicola]|nr:Cutinase-like protein [Paramyrothecium foliicola]
MKAILTAALITSSVVSGLPFTSTESSDIEDGWLPILGGKADAECSDLAVIFARGTFDSGNIGTFVGAPFRDDLLSKHSSVAFQGVDPSAYPADLAGYIQEGGSKSCAKSLATDVEVYASACPQSKIVISGWSQGALCARKSFLHLEDPNNQVAAFVAFGDPVNTWRETISFPQLPSHVSQISLCNNNPTDPLCGKPLQDFPSTPFGIMQYFKDMCSSFDQASLNWSQKKSVASVVIELPKQAAWQLGRFAKDLVAGNLQRWMLSPQHFFYGMDGSVQKASDQILALL